MTGTTDRWTRITKDNVRDGRTVGVSTPSDSVWRLCKVLDLRTNLTLKGERRTDAKKHPECLQPGSDKCASFSKVLSPDVGCLHLKPHLCVLDAPPAAHCINQTPLCERTPSTGPDPAQPTVKMAAQVLALLLLLGGSVLLALYPPGSGPDSDARGMAELRRVQSLATQPRYGGCWARALDNLNTRCTDMTLESQNRIALSFTFCHLSSSGRDFPSCPEGSEVSSCTGAMDAVAFNAYTEFFTHTHSICQHLQSEAWQSRAENTMFRLTESSAGVAEQLLSTRQMAEDLIEAQTLALQAQKEILDNGEELRVTLQDSTQELPDGGGSQPDLLLLQCCCPLHRLPPDCHAALLQSQVDVVDIGWTNDSILSSTLTHAAAQHYPQCISADCHYPECLSESGQASASLLLLRPSGVQHPGGGPTVFMHKHCPLQDVRTITASQFSSAAGKRE
ncbi:hypothetical protein F7725_001242 [Dissostichus mawsoni]|uniref:Uncharacterized protein n=1 Tax=Dissostichus mawsoni TaxID=36200 RepID=A0A7J5ZJW4_DISMA|nr:hypothetical protein F7725_001242 [Dissostichus mawsoni]